MTKEQNTEQEKGRRDTKEAILEESARLFAEKGYDATGIDEIAKSVGITKSVIYYHFENKDDILKTLLQGLLDQLDQAELKRAHQTFHQTGEQLGDLMQMVQVLLTERNQRILQIALMESTKHGTQDVPLFQLWELSGRMHKEIDPDLVDNAWEDDAELRTKVFFMGFLPLVGFLALGERWCQYYNISKTQAWSSMVEALEQYFRQIRGPITKKQ